jgi:enoyl-[acyl-carrier protein] reductase I
MKGKKGLILGVANESSIAWGVAKTLHEQGAELAFTYQNPKTAEYVVPLFKSVNSPFYEMLDITSEDGLKQVIGNLRDTFNGELDFVVHSVAGGPSKDELHGSYINITQEGFAKSMLVSVYSFTAVLRETKDMMKGRNASAITMSYYGSDKVIPNYNVMGVAKAALESSVRYLAADLGPQGIRVNALSPGTIKTRAASGIGDFDTLTECTIANSPLRRGVTQLEVGNASLFLLSELSSGITGEILYVDAGYNIIGCSLNCGH